MRLSSYVFVVFVVRLSQTAVRRQQKLSAKWNCLIGFPPDRFFGTLDCKTFANFMRPAVPESAFDRFTLRMLAYLYQAMFRCSTCHSDLVELSVQCPAMFAQPAGLWCHTRSANCLQEQAGWNALDKHCFTKQISFMEEVWHGAASSVTFSTEKYHGDKWSWLLMFMDIYGLHVGVLILWLRCAVIPWFLKLHAQEARASSNRFWNWRRFVLPSATFGILPAGPLEAMDREWTWEAADTWECDSTFDACLLLQCQSAASGFYLSLAASIQWACGRGGLGILGASNQRACVGRCGACKPNQLESIVE